MIKLQVIGNLGKDCTTNMVNSKNVINFNVAHTEKFKDHQGVQQTKTTWVECAYWTDSIGIAPYLKKGTQVYVEGAPEVRTYTNKEGQAGASLSLKAFSVQLLGTKGSGDGGSGDSDENGQRSTYNSQSQPQNNVIPEVNEPMDDLPF